MLSSMSLFQIPQPVAEKVKQLKELVNKHPVDIPLPEAAKLMGTNPETLRAAIDRGNFKPGYSWRRELATTKGYKIPTVPFYLWYMQSWISAELITGEEERR